MVVCSVFGCKSYMRYSDKKNEPGITFHRFPLKNPERGAWIRQMSIENWTPTKNHRICSKHFEPNSFYKVGKRTFLLDEAVPTQFTKCVLVKLPEHIQHEVEHSRGSSEEFVDPLALTPPNVKKLEEDSVDSPGNLRRKLCKELMRSQEKSKKLNVLQQKLKRSKIKISSLMQMLKDLKRKNLVSSENNMPEIYKELQNRPLGKNNHYSPELKKFAVTLSSISPKAYDYVREVFDTRLPCKSSIEKWSKNNNNNYNNETQGSTSESFDILESEFDASELNIKSETMEIAQENELNIKSEFVDLSETDYSINKALDDIPNLTGSYAFDTAEVNIKSETAACNY